MKERETVGLKFETFYCFKEVYEMGNLSWENRTTFPVSLSLRRDTVKLSVVCERFNLEESGWLEQWKAW